MPIKQDETAVADVENVPATVCKTDIDFLVDKISETLRLKAKQKQRVYSRRGSSRSSPYSIPCHHTSKIHSRDYGRPCSCMTMNCRCNRNEPTPKATTDPFELLQDLLRDGTLIKEAVSRLHNNKKLREEGERRSFCYDESLNL